MNRGSGASGLATGFFVLLLTRCFGGVAGDRYNMNRAFVLVGAMFVVAVSSACDTSNGTRRSHQRGSRRSRNDHIDPGPAADIEVRTGRGVA